MRGEIGGRSERRDWGREIGGVSEGDWGRE